MKKRHRQSSHSENQGLCQLPSAGPLRHIAALVGQAVIQHVILDFSKRGESFDFHVICMILGSYLIFWWLIIRCLGGGFICRRWGFVGFIGGCWGFIGGCWGFISGCWGFIGGCWGFICGRWGFIGSGGLIAIGCCFLVCSGGLVCCSCGFICIVGSRRGGIRV